MFRKIHAAYTVLADPMSRAAYDRRQGVTATMTRGRVPTIMLSRVSGPIAGLLACGAVRHAPGDVIELLLNADEAATGGMISIAMRVPVRCPACVRKGMTVCDRCGGKRVIDDLFSAWLAVPPGVHDGEILPPSALMPGMITRLMFRVRLT
jgi:hypothetical protein